MGQPPLEIARRCSLCGYDWPDERDYLKCPSCDEATDRCKDVTPMDSDEAKSLRAHMHFERYYEDYDYRMPRGRLDPTEEDAAKYGGLRTT